MKHVVLILLKFTFIICVVCWCWDFAYADWLRFSSPIAPNAATGQVVFEKAVKGVFYITSVQHFWVDSILLYIAATAILAASLYFLLRRIFGFDTGVPGTKLSPATENFVAGLGCLSLASYVLLFVLLFFGDHFMQLIFAGTWSLPPEPR